MKKIRRQSAKRNTRYNTSKYKNPGGIGVIVTARVCDANKVSKLERTYEMKDNGRYLRLTRIDGIKKYPPIYKPLFGSNSIQCLMTFILK